MCTPALSIMYTSINFKISLPRYTYVRIHSQVYVYVRTPPLSIPRYTYVHLYIFPGKRTYTSSINSQVYIRTPPLSIPRYTYVHLLYQFPGILTYTFSINSQVYVRTPPLSIPRYTYVHLLYQFPGSEYSDADRSAKTIITRAMLKHS